jgi:hypothetical protein
MDTERFDALARLAAHASRRRVITGLLAVSVAGLLRQQGVAAAPGDYENRGQRCDGDDDCNAPCRYCNDTHRCVYACDEDPTQNLVCDASATSCGHRGCCVPA